jgi:hypothetical protein
MNITAEFRRIHRREPVQGDCMTFPNSTPSFYVFDGKQWVDGAKAMSQTICAQVQL